MKAPNVIEESRGVQTTSPGPVKLIKTKGTAFERDYRLQADDVIVALNGKHWSQIDCIEATVKKAIESSGRPLLITLVRDNISFSVFVTKPLPKNNIVVLTGEDAQAFIEIKLSMPIEYIRTLSNFTILVDPENTADAIELRKAFIAMIFPPFWLIARRLWGPLVAFTCAFVTAFVVHNVLGVLTYVLMCFYIGARQIHLATVSLQRDGMRPRMVVAARDEKEAQLIARKFNEKLRFKFSEVNRAYSENLDVEIV